VFSGRQDTTAPPASDPGEVIWEFYSRPDAPRQGRLGLRPEAIRVVEWAAKNGLVGTGERIPTARWAEIARELERTNAGARELYRTAKLAYAVVYYVVGGLGPPGALRDPEALARAVFQFRANFQGQSAWSVLKFAAHSAIPFGEGAQIDPDLYAESIRLNPEQAGNLGWTPDGPAPAELLHPVEHQAAAAFGCARPWCVLAPRAANPAGPAPRAAADPAGPATHDSESLWTGGL
jgi:hypothetical protein